MSALLTLITALAAGTVRMIDLTHTLAPEFPTIVMPRNSASAPRSAWRKFPAMTNAVPLGTGTTFR
ncbi:MAG: hypothetical protein ABSC06_01300 [Rhodopila sp.]|jgi:hypothetical protein